MSSLISISNTDVSSKTKFFAIYFYASLKYANSTETYFFYNQEINLDLYSFDMVLCTFSFDEASSWQRSERVVKQFSTRTVRCFRQRLRTKLLTFLLSSLNVMALNGK